MLQVRRQQVEFAQEQSGTTTGNVGGGETDPGGGQIRNGLDDGDWLAINNRVNLTNMNKQITFRFANNAAAGTDRVNVEIHLDSPTGPLATTATLKATGGNNTYTEPDVPAGLHGFAQGVPGVQAGGRRGHDRVREPELGRVLRRRARGAARAVIHRAAGAPSMRRRPLTRRLRP